MSSTGTAIRIATDLMPRVIAATGMSKARQAEFRDALSGMNYPRNYISKCSENDKQYILCSTARALTNWGVPSVIARRAKLGYDGDNVTAETRELVSKGESILSAFGGELEKVDFEKQRGLKRDIDAFAEEVCRVQFGDDDDAGTYDQRGSVQTISDRASSKFSGTNSKSSQGFQTNSNYSDGFQTNSRYDSGAFNSCGSQFRVNGWYSGSSGGYSSHNPVYSIPSIVSTA